MKKKSWAELFYTTAKKKLNLKTWPKQSQILYFQWKTARLSTSFQIIIFMRKTPL